MLRNEHLVAVIGEAIEGRNANMTVRNVGGSVIDLTQRTAPSDQLSAYYPLGIGYKLTGPIEGDKAVGQGATPKLTFRGPALDERSTAEVIYELAESARLKITTKITNTSKQALD